MKIEFTKDFANRLKGEVVDFDGLLASRLIKEGVAKKHVAKKARKPRENKNAAPKNLEDK